MTNSIKPYIWGPSGWKFIHYISFGYPNNPTDEDKINYKNFYNNLQYVLPCKKCSINYNKNITEHPIDNHLEDRDSLVKWLIDIHNKVNEESNKKQLDYQTAIDIYLSGKNYDNLFNSNIFLLLILIIIVLMIYIIYQKCKK